MTRYVRDEDRSYRGAFLVLGLAFAAVTVWAVVDEAWTRRPWKEVQAAWLEREGAGAADVSVRQIVVPTLGVVDRCPTCHVAVEEAGPPDPTGPLVLRAHPAASTLLAQHSVLRFGCTPCHGGQGLALTEGTAHGEEDPDWLDPLARGPFVQSRCLGCHPGTGDLIGAPLLSEGRRTFRALGCAGCHVAQDGPREKRRGPSLARVASKLTPGVALAFLRDPKRRRSDRRMPRFWPGSERDEALAAVRDRESLAIVAYLLRASLPSPESEAAPPRDPALEPEGRRLLDRIGCRGCHVLGIAGEDDLLIREDKPAQAASDDAWEDFDEPEAEAGDDAWESFGEDEPAAEPSGGAVDAVTEGPLTPIEFGPALGEIGGRVRYEFLYAWLRAPGAFWKDATMPELRVTPAEARALASFLAPLGAGGRPADPPELSGSIDPALAAQGKALIGRYGCHGCHEIPGFEDEGQPGPELTDFARKDTHDMDFGRHAVGEGERTWERYAETKLRSPRAFATEQIPLSMPDLELSEHEALALTVFLGGLRGGAVPREYVHDPPGRLAVEAARQLVTDRNCHGCHTFQGLVGDIGRYYAAAHLAPPPLDVEGARTQPQWLFGFLLQPSALRPWLEARMPRFRLSQEEAQSLVLAFSEWSGKDAPLRAMRLLPIATERAALGEHLFKELKCVSCHLLDNEQGLEVAKLAPDLGLARQRLDPAWVRSFLEDPGKVMPGTAMPQFFPEGQTPLKDLLGGDVGAQMDLLVDHLMNLGLQPVRVPVAEER